MSERAILTLNAGSSSIKFALYEPGQEPKEIVVGQVSNLGPAARLAMYVRGQPHTNTDLGAADHGVALQAILAHARTMISEREVAGVGHRIAHGGINFYGPKELDEAVIAKLRVLEPLAPLHQPHNLAAVDAARRVFPDALQIGCFDTAFHRGQPWVDDTFALPRRFYEQGVRRYGFHGLSYEYVNHTLRTIAPEISNGRVVIAHLGNGASMCAIRDGRSIASTMGFSALDGLPMGTRCGQLDPGVLLYLMDQQQLSAAQITDLLYRDSGLKGLSGLTNDMRQLEKSEAPEAAQAIDYFIFRVRRELGAMCAALGGIDALIFCGGIGENSARVRARVCDGMDWIGIRLDEARNGANQLRISQESTAVLVIKTDEERIIARAVNNMLKGLQSSESMG